MAVRKLSISLSEEVAEAAARLAKQQGLTVSSWLGQAAERAIKLSEGRAAIEEQFRLEGPPDAESRAWAAEVIRKLQAGESIE